MSPASLCLLLSLVQNGTEGGKALDSEPSGVHVVVVVEGAELSVAGIGVRAGQERVITNAEGGAFLPVPPGSYRLLLEFPAGHLHTGPDDATPGPARSVELPEIVVPPGQVSELIVTLSPDGKVLGVLDEVAGRSNTVGPAEVEAAAPSAPPGKLLGQVVSLEDGKPIAGARVFVRGTTFEVETDKDGRFTLTLPSGTQALSIIHTRFSTRTMDAVEVPPNGEATILVELSPAAVELDELVVTAPHIEGTVASVVDERRETTEVAEILGAEQMSKAGDSNAASALTRVTGVTLVGGRFIYVRGLGERYSSTLLNGADLPSPDPSRRVIPLDLFPTGVLGSVVVQKTYSPDMPGDFSGGVVQLRTRGVPEEFNFSLGVSTGGNSIATFQDGYTYRGSKTDWLGFDDGTRAIPDFIWDITEGGTRSHNAYPGPGSTLAQRNAANAAKIKSFEHNYRVNELLVPPNFGADLSIGDRTVFGRDIKIGYQFAGQYDNGWRYRPERRLQIVQDTVAGGLRADFPKNIKQSNQEINLSSIATLAVEIGRNHLIEGNALLTRKTAKIASIDFTTTADYAERNEYTLRWNEQRLFSQQLRGEHRLPWLNGLKFSWMASHATSGRDEPDTREYMYTRNAPTPEEPSPEFAYAEQAAPLLRSYETMAEAAWVYGADVKLPIQLGTETELTLTTGVMHSRSDRDARVLRFSFAIPRKLPPEVRSRPADDIFSDPAIIDAPSPIVRFQEKTTLTDAYSALSRVTGTYLMAEVARRDWLRLQAGARLEYALISATTRPHFTDAAGTDQSVTGTIRRMNVLPAATATFNTSDESQVRLAVSRTVNRPQLRELSAAVFVDPDTRFPYIGDPQLKPADITNYDVRFEYYPSKTESFSVATFIKQFRNPIEIRTFPSGEAGILSNRILFNIEGATNYGLEFDARHELDRWHDVLEGFYVAGNLAFIGSQVEISPEQAGGLTNLKRPMQGQSPWITNVQLGYTEPEHGKVDAMISFNMIGKRLIEVGEKPLPDVYEIPVPMLDATVSYLISKSVRIKFTGRNLVDATFRVQQGSQFQRVYRRGRTLGVLLTYDF